MGIRFILGSHWPFILQTVRHGQTYIHNNMPLTLSEAHPVSQTTFIMGHYILLMISNGTQNKPPTLSSQSDLAFNAKINRTFFTDKFENLQIFVWDQSLVRYLTLQNPSVLCKF